MSELSAQERQTQRRLTDKAIRMATAGRPREEVVEYLTEVNFENPAATTDLIFFRVAEEKAQKAAALKQTRNSAYWRIAGGVVAVIVGLATISGGTTGGRRSPVGILLIGIASIVSGVVDLVKLRDH